jgi:hypothetical protein
MLWKIPASASGPELAVQLGKQVASEESACSNTEVQSGQGWPQEVPV